MAAAELPPAYYISAHGGEGDPEGKIRLPAGCTVIARSKPGQFSISKVVADTAKTIFCDFSDVYTQPLQNMKKIVNKLGSVAVYQAGDMCPNFKFKLLLTHWRKRDLIVAPVSGLIPIPEDPLDRALICNAFSVDAKKVPRSAPAKDIVPDLFKFSVFPTRERIEELIEEDEEGSDSDEEESGEEDEEESDSEEEDSDKEGAPLTIEDIAADDESELMVTLSDLLEIRPDGSAGRPGIYYNFSCRGVAVTDLYDIEKANGEAFMVPSHGERIPNIRPGATLTKRAIVRRLLLNTIAEAEGRRKHLIRGTRYARAKPRGRKTRRKHRK